MTTAFDVPADVLIKRIAEKLKTMEAIKPPEWAAFGKTGVHKERAPTDPNWWFPRVSAVLRKVYLQGPIGSKRLSDEYGGRCDMRCAPKRAKSGSGSIARLSIRQLEQSGLVQPLKNRGRVVTAQGRKLVDHLAHEILLEMTRTRPELVKYL